MVHMHVRDKYILDSYKNLSYRFFNRHGGVSSGPFESLNISTTVGDALENVLENRLRIAKYFHNAPMAFMNQVHGNQVAVVESKPSTNSTLSEVDALITQVSDVVLVVQHADCQPILLYDPETQSIGAIHNGWKGSCCNCIEATIQKMVEHFAVSPSNLIALIGPSLCPNHSEFKNYLHELPEQFYPFITKELHFNFWEISKMQMVNAGVAASNIQCINICTYCDPQFFSFRRDKTTGRIASCIMLKAQSG